MLKCKHFRKYLANYIIEHTDTKHHLFFKQHKNNLNLLQHPHTCQVREFFFFRLCRFFKSCISGAHLQYYFDEGSMTSRSTKTKSVMGDRTNTCQKVALTNKRLDLLLPSTKLLMLNSSIKYNTGETVNEKTISKHQLEAHASAPKEQEEGQQNNGALFGTSAKGSRQVHRPTLKQGDNGIYLVAQNSQYCNALLQTYKSIKEPASQHIGKPFSAIQLPTFQQANQKNLTSLNNIIPNGRDAKQQNEGSASNEELMKRVDILQKLVQDIINGKVVIHRKSKSQIKMKVSKPERTSVKILEECTRKSKNRSVTWNAQVSQDSSKSLKSNKSKSRLKLESPEDRKMFNIIRIPIINPKGFVIKKKNQLKLTTNYQPIREQCQEKTEAKNIPKYISPIGERSSQSNLYPKLRTKVLFVPNLINM